MVCRHLTELYELFLLGTLSGEEEAAARGHLEHGCLACLAQLREAALIVYFLSQTARPARPDPKLKAQLLCHLRKK
jgi:hypothetical protein